MRLLSWRWWLGLKPEFTKWPHRAYGITVIIPAYNEGETIAQTIASVRRQHGIPGGNAFKPVQEIIVVDDCSTDNTGQVAKDCGATVIRTHKNQGTKAMAQNYVLDHVKTELVVTIDADTILASDAIARTLAYFNDPKTASVCGFVIPQKIETIWERGRFIEYIFGISWFKSAQDHVHAVLVSSGCFSVFRTKLLRQFGGFKQRTMAEDMDLTWEFTIAGYHIYCAQDAYCFPLDPPTGKIFINQIDRWTRSFFQNIAIHSFRKNKLLGAFVYAYLLEGLLSPFIIIWGLYYIAHHNIMMTILLGLIMEAIVVGVPCLIKGVRIGMFWRVFSSLPSYLIIRPVNFYVFWRSLYLEWIKGERLTDWAKGH